MLLAALKSKWALVGGAALLFAAILALAYCSGRTAGTNAADLAREKANVEALATASAAAEAAAEERGSDAASIAEQRKELSDAKWTCTGADDCRNMRGCIILRQQGKDLSGIAACRRFAGGSGTAVSP